MKPSIPQGTRDFSPTEVKKRQYILNTIKEIFILYGYQPLETPSMENLSTLMGKYGEEGDRLIFKILNNGLGNSKNIEQSRAAFENVLNGKNDINLTERALRYDLTIPFARYVVMHHNDLQFPFKRYQMQPVWRADRPQRGRYREFWQCDADVVGSDSLINEAELINIYRNAFGKLNIPGVSIKLNNRKILAGLAECCGAFDKLVPITIAIDKLDKIGLNGVNEEMQQRGLNATQIEFITTYLSIEGNIEEKLEKVSNLLSSSEVALKGVDELKQVIILHRLIENGNWDSKVEIDFTLARGLNYYTGIIFEVTTNSVKMGSIGGGGRYDDLTGLFGLKGISGVGISFGIDRIYDVIEELHLFPETIISSTKVLFTHTKSEALPTILSYVNQLRNAGIPAEVYSGATNKLEKQMKYAHKNNTEFVAIIGDEELEEGIISIKNMSTGLQEKRNINEVIALLSNS